MDFLFLRKVKSIISVCFGFDFLYSKNDYSQWGESEFIKKVLSEKDNGFYLDIGAHHPYRYSNTYLLYKNGWRGIVVEPDTSSKIMFTLARPKDIFVNLALHTSSFRKKYYIFKDNALNTIDSKTFQNVVKSGQSKLVKTQDITPITFSYLIKKYLPKQQRIDLINIDTEGSDFDIISSINWNLVKPKYILIEASNSQINKLLSKQGYKKYQKYGLTQTYILK